jgi:N-acylneuraminate cytidylyltransferase
MITDIIAIIPARSGSKGVPDKNIQMLAGHPLLTYSIAAARLAGIERVILSTDSEQYATIGRFYGAEAPFLRPSHIATDQATDYQFMRHAMEWLREQEPQIPEFWMHLRPTTPLRDPDILRAALRSIQSTPAATSLRSGHVAPESPFKWFMKNEQGFFRGLREDLTPEKVNLPRQTFPVVYIPDGYVDIVRSSYVLSNADLHGDAMLVFESPRCTEVDDPDDFTYLEYELQRQGSTLTPYLNTRATGVASN